MSTSATVPIHEYLTTSYRPDCEYVDGEIQERNFGEQDHSDLQMRIAMLLSADKNLEYIRVNPELRVQVQRERFRVPDICVRRRMAPSEQIVTQPPLLCIEILSPEDTMVRDRVRDYLDMGVPEAWVVNPAARTVMTFTSEGIAELSDGELKVPQTPVTLALTDIFSVLDEY